MPFRDPPFYPVDRDTPIVVNAGEWVTSDGKHRLVVVTFDPDLLQWGVNRAWFADGETLIIKLGTPSMTVELVA